MEPVNAFAFNNVTDFATVKAFLLAGAIIISSIDAMHIGRRNAVESRELVLTTLSSIGDAVIVTDSTGHVSFQNREAERLTGWRSEEAKGKLLEDVFNIVNESTRHVAENPVQKVLSAGSKRD